jgi:predicted permease
VNAFVRKLSWLFRRRRKKADLQDELRFHLEEDAADRTAQGIDADRARLEARRELGNRTLVEEDTRAAWGWTFIEQLAQDLRYAARAIGASRLFSSLAILSLALGIGANTAIFSFMDAIMLRSLPVARPESLVTLSTVTKESEVHGVSRHDDTFLDPAEGYGDSVFAYPAFERLSADAGVFSDVFGFQNAGNLHVTVGSDADLANTEYVTGNYFTGLGISAAAGRLLQPDDDRLGAPAAIVTSHAFARRFFGDADRAPGQQIRLNGQPFVIAGVTPPAFSGTDPGTVPALYVPMRAILLPSTDTVRAGTTSFTDPNFEWVIVMARLRPGVTRAQAQAALAPPFSNWMRTVNTERNRADLPRLLVRDGSAGLNGVRYRYANALVILFAVVILILAIACANIANLLLARATARRREIAVRLSLGAGRFRIIRQLLTESVLISALGGVLGTLLAVWGIRALTMLLASGREDFRLRPDVNWRVLAATAGLSLLTGILFGLAPALHATRGNLVPGLKEPRTGRTGRSVRLSRALMAGQFALGLAILVAAGLFVQTLAHLEAVPLGFNPENVLTFRVDASQAGHPAADVPAFYNRLRTRLAAVPGVRGASLSELALLDGRTATGVSAAGKSQASLIFGVGAGFHSTMQVPMLSGREIGERDVTGAPRTAVVNQAFVDRFFNGKNPLGQSVTMRNDCGCTLEIVGVSADVLMGNNVKSRRGPELFYPFHGAAVLEGVTFELRTDGDPMAYASIVRQLVREADPRLPVSELRTERALIDGTLNREVVFARLCTGFALLALVIACVGLYGTMSYHVARHTSEIGVRMALGAPRRGVVWMVLRQVLAMAAAGLAIGIPAALLGSKLLAAFLYEVEPRDPATLCLAAASLLTAAALAGFLPAWQASRINPVTALRHE